MKFGAAKKMFAQDKIRELAGTSEGLKFLKLRTLSRKAHLDRLFNRNGIEREGAGSMAMFKQAYESRLLGSSEIDEVIREIYEEERSARRDQEPGLVSNFTRFKNLIGVVFIKIISRSPSSTATSRRSPASMTWGTRSITRYTAA